MKKSVKLSSLKFLTENVGEQIEKEVLKIINEEVFIDNFNYNGRFIYDKNWYTYQFSEIAKYSFSSNKGQFETLIKTDYKYRKICLTTEQENEIEDLNNLINSLKETSKILEKNRELQNLLLNYIKNTELKYKQIGDIKDVTILYGR